jgi:hypothetical protein
MGFEGQTRSATQYKEKQEEKINKRKSNKEN